MKKQLINVGLASLIGIVGCTSMQPVKDSMGNYVKDYDGNVVYLEQFDPSKTLLLVGGVTTGLAGVGLNKAKNVAQAGDAARLAQMGNATSNLGRFIESDNNSSNFYDERRDAFNKTQLWGGLFLICAARDDKNKDKIINFDELCNVSEKRTFNEWNRAHNNGIYKKEDDIKFIFQQYPSESLNAKTNYKIEITNPQNKKFEFSWRGKNEGQIVQKDFPADFITTGQYKGLYARKIDGALMPIQQYDIAFQIR